MAENWQGLWPENCARAAKRVVVSERFKDEDGKPLEWQVEPLTAWKMQAICREGAGGSGLGMRLLAAAVSEPDLNSAELQDKWGVMGADRLLLAMLSPGEMAVLESAFREVNL